MKFCRYLLIGLLALFLGGCGTIARESLKVQPVTKSKIGVDKTVVILPFADYTFSDNLESAYRRDLFICENLTDQFVKNSFNLPNQEDVNLYLIDHNIINVGSFNTNKAPTLEQELSKDWSDRMKATLQYYIDQAQNSSRNNSVNGSPGTHGLTQQEIIKIGRHFSADYIVRGRIIQYKDRLDPNWAPWNKGIVPFVVGVGGRTLFGNANTDKYDEGGSSRSSDTSRVLSGDVPQAAVQLRVWIQDAYTGNVIWTNRIDVKASPESFLADNKYDVLFEEATQNAIIALIDDFTKNI